MEVTDMLHMRGTAREVISGATANTDVTYNVGSYNALLVIHSMSGESASGYVSVNLVHGGVDVPHHGKGTNIPPEAQSSSYSCIFEGLTDKVVISLACTGGTHTVIAIPLVVW